MSDLCYHESVEGSGAFCFAGTSPLVCGTRRSLDKNGKDTGQRTCVIGDRRQCANTDASLTTATYREAHRG